MRGHLEIKQLPCSVLISMKKFHACTNLYILNTIPNALLLIFTTQIKQAYPTNQRSQSEEGLFFISVSIRITGIIDLFIGITLLIT